MAPFEIEDVLKGEAGQRHVTLVGPPVYEHSSNDFATYDTHTLANVPSVPTSASVMATHIGDYAKLQAADENFCGAFSANNTPTMTNFPSGITYQLNVDWATGTLLVTDDMTPISPSTDPRPARLTQHARGFAPLTLRL